MTTLCFFVSLTACRSLLEQFQSHFVLNVKTRINYPNNSKKYGKNLHKMKPRYCEHILPVLWPFVISRFHYTFYYKIQIQTTIPIVSRWPVQNNYQCMEKANLQRNSSLSSRSFLCCHRLPGYQARNYSFSHRSLL